MHVKLQDSWLPVQVWEHVAVHEEVLPCDDEDSHNSILCIHKEGH